MCSITPGDKTDSMEPYQGFNIGPNKLRAPGLLDRLWVGNLTDGIPPQDELDVLIGLTGQDLLDMGFAYGSGYSFWDKAEMYLVQGLYEYHICFNEKVPEMENYDEALDELMPTLTVEKVEFFMPDGICSDPDLNW